MGGEEKKWTQACGLYAEAAAGRSAGTAVAKSRRNHSSQQENRKRRTCTDTTIASELINAEWDELKVYDTVINTSCITSRKHCPLRETRRDGERNESEIAGSLVRDFWAATEYGGVPELLNRPRNRGHRLIAR